MTAETCIEELTRNKLLGKRVDPVGFVEELLSLASREGEIQCTHVGDEALRFTIPQKQVVFDVPVDRARGKLRMMCARLAVLRQESGEASEPYGGAGVIQKPGPDPSPNGAAGKWRVSYHNTPGQHDFTITALQEAETRAR